MKDGQHDKTVMASLKRHVMAHPDAPCISLWRTGSWDTVTRGEFWQRVEGYAGRFAAALPPESLVLFIKRLDLDLLTAYIGAMLAGCIPAQLSPASSKISAEEHARKLAHVFQLTGAAGVFTDTDAHFPLEDVLRLTPETPLPSDPPELPSPSKTALVQFSSGSTGLQKGVSLTHQGLHAHMRSYAQALELSEQDSLISWLPLYHDMGLIAGFLMPLMEGIPLYLMDPFDWILKPDRLLEAIEGQRPTLCFLPNFAYHVLVNKGKPRDLSSIRLFINCSEPARPLTHDAFLRAFPTVRREALGVCYALAENTFAVAQTPPAQVVRPRSIEGKEVLSCGFVLPGTEVRILEPNGEGVGEIAIKGEFCFANYLGQLPELVDGFYRTGDLGLLTDEGEIFVTGRKKDLIIVNGKNIYPQDVESCCSEVKGVYPGRSVAFGIINPAMGSEELIVIVERDGSIEDTPLKLSLQRAIEGEVGILPKRIEVVEHMRLVKTSSGKISRSRNKELYLQGEFH